MEIEGRRSKIICGVDLAVRRRSSIALLEGEEITVIDVEGVEKILEECRGAQIVAVDSPLSHSSGHRQVDREMMRAGYRVLPPSWMRGLVDRAILIAEGLRTVETHPTSSMRNLGLSPVKPKDHLDSVLCALAGLAVILGIAQEIRASDGVIYLVPKSFPYLPKPLGSTLRWRLERRS